MGGPFGEYQQEGENRECKLQSFAAVLAGVERLLAPCGGRTTAEPACLPKCKKIEDCAHKSNEHHGDADGIDVETLGELPGGGSQHHRADSDQKANAMKSNERTTNALNEGEEEAGPIEPLETGGWLRDGGFVRDGLGLEGLGHGRIP